MTATISTACQFRWRQFDVLLLRLRRKAENRAVMADDTHPIQIWIAGTGAGAMKPTTATKQQRQRCDGGGSKTSNSSHKNTQVQRGMAD
jgi:hypothetical protein